MNACAKEESQALPSSSTSKDHSETVTKSQRQSQRVSDIFISLILGDEDRDSFVTSDKFREEDCQPVISQRHSSLRGEIIRKMTEENKGDTDFSQPWNYSDIIFVLEGKKLHANKMILSMWSPVFEAMFRNNFREKDAKEIELPDKKFDHVLELMKVLHPPNKEITDDNVVELLPLVQEYQMDKLQERCEDCLLSQSMSIKNYLIAQRFNLSKLQEASLAYLKRAPVGRLKSQAEFDTLDSQLLVELLMEKCEKFEKNLEALREVRMVLERKKPTTFPGMHLLCEQCTGAREQQVDCNGCMKSCCKKITDILRALER